MEQPGFSTDKSGEFIFAGIFFFLIHKLLHSFEITPPVKCIFPIESGQQKALTSAWDTANIHCCSSQAGAFLRAVSISTCSACVSGFSIWYAHFQEKGGSVEEYQIDLLSAMSKIMSRYQGASVSLAVVT